MTSHLILRMMSALYKQRLLTELKLCEANLQISRNPFADLIMIGLSVPPFLSFSTQVAHIYSV